jgi:hypothetical protein
MLFHDPQSSHLPAHLLWDVPQDWQTYIFAGLAMKFPECIRSFLPQAAVLQKEKSPFWRRGF